MHKYVDFTFANCNPAISSNALCLNAAHTIGCFFWQMQYKGKIVTFPHFNVIPKVILIKLQIGGRGAGARSHFVRTRSVHEGLLATAHRDLARSSGQTNTKIQIYKDMRLVHEGLLATAFSFLFIFPIASTKP